MSRSGCPGSSQGGHLPTTALPCDSSHTGSYSGLLCKMQSHEEDKQKLLGRLLPPH